MTVIEMRFMEVAVSRLPELVGELKRLNANLEKDIALREKRNQQEEKK